MTNPGYLWMPRDWLSSTFVASLKRADRDIYRELLDRAWLDDGLPDDLGELARILAEPRARFEVLWAKLLADPNPKFVRGDDNRWRNPKQERERAYQQAKAAAGRIGGQNRQANAKQNSSKRQAESAGPPGVRQETNGKPPTAPAPAPPPSAEESAARASAAPPPSPFPRVEAPAGPVPKRQRASPFAPRAVLAEFPELDGEPVAKALEVYLEARRAKWGAWTAQGMRIALRKFAGKSREALIAGFERATEGPWQTVWPDDKSAVNGHAPKPSAPSQTPHYLRGKKEREERAAWEAAEQERLDRANRARQAVQA